MPRLSVIVPVYNVEAFLPICIESILAQTMQDLELILIDDGSPDGCGKICDTYVAKDPRIKVLHQKNRGVSNARNAGLRIALGDYLGFVDPDDYIDKNMYSEMIHEAEKNSCGIAICGIMNCMENGEPLNREAVPAGVFIQKQLILSVYGMPNPFHGSMCNKVFSRHVLEGLFFDEEVSIGEDWLLLYKCYQRAEKAVAVENCYYTVRSRTDSATRKRTAQLYMKKLETYDKLFRYAAKKDKEVQKKATDKIVDTYINNKNEIIKNDYNLNCLRKLNNRLITISIQSFLRGNLSFKRMVYYVLKGFQY